MKLTKKPALELFAIIGMVAIVLILAVLQYRWTTEISRTEQLRLKTELATSVRTIDQEFSYDIERLCESFEMDFEAPTATTEQRAARLYSDWTRTASHPGLVSGLAVWRIDQAHYDSIETLNPETRQFESAPWPSKLDSLHDFLRAESTASIFLTTPATQCISPGPSMEPDQP
jgi:hypothetical protein